MSWKLFVVVALVGLSAPRPAPAKCAWCYSGMCVNNSICGGQGCVCMKQGGQVEGVCVSLGRIVEKTR